MKVFTWLSWIQTKWQANQRNLGFYKQKQPKKKSSVFGMSVLNLSISKQMCNLTCFESKKKKDLSLVTQNALVISFLWYPHPALTIHIVHLGQFMVTWVSSNLTPINHKPTVYLLQTYSKLSISFILNGVRHPEERWFLTLFRGNASILLGAAWLPEPSKSSAGPITRRHSFKRSSFPERWNICHLQKLSVKRLSAPAPIMQAGHL